MMKDAYMRMVETSLNFVDAQSKRIDELARVIYGLIEGDGPEEAAALLFELGYTDCDGFWIGEDEE